MDNSYKFDVITNQERQSYIQKSQIAIARIREEIARLNSEENGENIPFVNDKPEEVTFYLKNILNIPLRASQDNRPTANESYYYEFIPINNPTILVSLRDTDHIHDESIADSQEGEKHPNLRATTRVTDGSGQIHIQPQKPHECNGIKIHRTTQIVPLEVLGTKQMIVSFLNSLLYLFKEGRFGKIKNKKSNTNEKMNKNRIRLTESQLHRIIKESVKNIVNEQNNNVLMQILTNYINGLQKYVSAGQYQQALKVSQVITAKINALMHQASQQQMQQNQQPAQQAQQYQQNAIG